MSALSCTHVLIYIQSPAAKLTLPIQLICISGGHSDRTNNSNRTLLKAIYKSLESITMQVSRWLEGVIFTMFTAVKHILGWRSPNPVLTTSPQWRQQWFREWRYHRRRLNGWYISHMTLQLTGCLFLWLDCQEDKHVNNTFKGQTGCFKPAGCCPLIFIDINEPPRPLFYCHATDTSNF